MNERAHEPSMGEKFGLMPETSLHDGLVDGDAIGRSRKVGVRIDQGALLIAG